MDEAGKTPASSSQEKRPLDREDSDDFDLLDQSEAEDLLEVASEAPTDASWPAEVDEAELDGEILIEEPQAARKQRKKKSLDAAALAARRVCKRLRQERKAAKKARRKAEAKAKKRRGFGADLEAFLVKTKERLETKAVEAEAAAAAALLAEPRASGDLRGFLAKTRERLAEKTELEKATEEARRAKAAALAANVDLEAFRKECQARIAQRLLAKMPQVRGGVVDRDTVDDLSWAGIHRRRVAIVGAGPVGLWAAMLMAQKYRWSDGTGCARLRPDAPEVMVFEARTMEQHCTRTDIRIALSSSTRAMLDQQTKSRSFTSGMPVAEIEDTFLRRWKKVAGHEAKIGYGSSVSDPAELAESGQFDCILWAAGRRSLSDEARKALGCDVKTGDSQRVVVFQVQELQGADAWQLGSLDLSGAAQQAGRFPGLRVMLRPGFEGACACWLWVFGLSSEVLESFVLKGASSTPRATLAHAFEDLVGETSQLLRPALEALQQRLKATGVTCRFVEASYWSADHAVCQLSLGDHLVPFVLLGDALGGKPFYTGSTLNRHLWDVATLIEEVEFAYDGGPLEAARFAMYERRYQECLRRIPEFQRPRTILLQALPKPMPVLRQKLDETRPAEPKILSLPALPSGRP